MTYPDSVQFLYALGNEIKTAKFGLERIRTVLEALGNPQQAVPCVHVAGTNGKGSVCAMIESGLRASGVRTGLFTSPHLVEPTERIRIGGEAVSREQFSAAFHRVHRSVEDLLREGRLDLHTTYFETVTAMAMLLFRECGVEFAVYEVGLGGRLDATNVVTPRVSAVTPIDFDHEAWLGRSLDQIAGEKAGILKPGVPAVFARQRLEAAAVLDARAAELGIRARRTSDWEIRDLQCDARGCRFVAGGRAIPCPLAGEHQVENALTALAVLDELGVDAEAAARGIAATRWPGRLEHAGEKPEVILDGAHNPAGARVLASYIQRYYSGRRVWMIYGTMRDKAVEEIAAILFPLAAEVIVTAPEQARAVRPEAIAEIADHPSLRAAPRLEDALGIVRAEAGPEDVVFITGSLFLVGEWHRRGALL